MTQNSTATVWRGLLKIALDMLKLLVLDLPECSYDTPPATHSIELISPESHWNTCLLLSFAAGRAYALLSHLLRPRHPTTWRDLRDSLPRLPHPLLFNTLPTSRPGPGWALLSKFRQSLSSLITYQVQSTRCYNLLAQKPAPLELLDPHRAAPRSYTGSEASRFPSRPSFLS